MAGKKRKANKRVQKILATALASSTLLIPAIANATDYAIDGEKAGVAVGTDTTQLKIDGADAGSWQSGDGNTVTMTGGTLDVSGYDGTTPALTNGIINATGGAITVSGGTFTVDASSIIKEAATIAINSGATLVNNGYINSPYNGGNYGTTINEGAILRTIGLDTWDTTAATKGFDGWVINEGTLQLVAGNHRVMVNRDATGARKGKIELLGDVKIGNMEVKADTFDLNGHTLDYSNPISNSLINANNLVSSAEGGKVKNLSISDALSIGTGGETPTTNNITGITFENVNGVVQTAGTVIIDAEKNTVGGSGYYYNIGNLVVTGGTSSTYATNASDIQGPSETTTATVEIGTDGTAAYINNTGDIAQKVKIMGSSVLKTNADLLKGDKNITAGKNATLDITGGTLARNVIGYDNEYTNLKISGDAANSSDNVRIGTLAVDSGKTLTNNGSIHIHGEAVSGETTTPAVSTVNGNITKGTGDAGTIEIGSVSGGNPVALANVEMKGAITGQNMEVRNGSELRLNGATLTDSIVVVDGGATFNSIDGAINDYMTNADVRLLEGAIVKGDINYGTGKADKYAADAGVTSITYAMANVLDAANPLEGGTKELQVTTDGVTVNKDANFAWYSSDHGLTLASSGTNNGKIKVSAQAGGIDNAIGGTTEGVHSTIEYDLIQDETHTSSHAIEDATFTINGQGNGSSDPKLTLASDLVIGADSKLIVKNGRFYSATGAEKVVNNGEIDSDPTTWSVKIVNNADKTADFNQDEFVGITTAGANGGAIENYGTLHLTDTDFTNNKTSTEGYVGGAIYSTKAFDVNAVTKAVNFSGNQIYKDGNYVANDIYMEGTSGSPITLALNAKDDTNTITLAGGVDGEYYNVNVNGGTGYAGTVNVAGIKGATNTTINAGTVSNTGLIDSTLVDIKTGAKLTTAGVDNTTTPTTGLNAAVTNNGTLELTGGTVNKDINHSGSISHYAGNIDLLGDLSVADGKSIVADTIDLNNNSLTLGAGSVLKMANISDGSVSGDATSEVRLGFGSGNSDASSVTFDVGGLSIFGSGIVTVDASKITTADNKVFVFDDATATLIGSSNANEYCKDGSATNASVIIAKSMTNTGAFTTSNLTINQKDASSNDITFTTDAANLATTNAVDNQGKLVLTGNATTGDLGADITDSQGTMTGTVEIGTTAGGSTVITNGHDITQSAITVATSTSSASNYFGITAGDTVTAPIAVGDNAVVNNYGDIIGDVTLTTGNSSVYLVDGSSSITGDVISDNGGLISVYNYSEDTRLSQITGDIKGSSGDGNYKILASGGLTHTAYIDKAIAGATSVTADYGQVTITDDAYTSLASSVGITVSDGVELTLDNKTAGSATVGSAISADTAGDKYDLNIVNSNATAGTTVIGAAVTDADDVNVKSGTVQFSADVTSDKLAVDSGATLNVDSGKTASGDLTNQGTINNSGTLSGTIDNQAGASLTTATTGLTTTSPIKNDSTLTFNDTTANATIAQSIQKSTAGGGVVELAGGASTVFKLADGETITDNSLKLSSGIFDATNLATSGNVDFTGSGLNLPLIANGGTLSVQDGLMGAINLGTVDTTAAGLNVMIDAQFTTGTIDASGITGTSDIITGSVTTPANKINVSDIKITADPIATEFKTQIADAASAGSVDLTATTLTGLSAGAGDIILEYDNTSGFLTGGHATLKDAIISTIPTKLYVVGDGDLSSAGNLTMGGNSLSVTAAGKTIQGGNNTVSLANSAQTLSISGGTSTATIQGFATAIDNAVGGTVNLDNVTMTGNTTDINNGNPGNLNLTGTNSINKVTGDGTTTVKSGTTTINTSLAQDTINVGDSSVPTDGALVNNGAVNAVNMNVNTAGSTYTNNSGKTTTLTGKLTNKGTVANNGTVSADTLDNQKTISGTGNMTLANGGKNAGTGASLTQNNVTLSGGTFDNDAAMTVNGLLTNDATLNNNSTLSANTLDNNSVIQGTGDFTVVAGGASDGVISQATVALTGGTFENNANITTTGAFTNGAALDNDSTITAGGAFTNTGVISDAAGTGSIIAQAGGSSTAAITQSVLDFTGGTFDNDADMTATTSFTVESGASLDNSAKILAETFSNAGTVTDATGNGALEVTSGGSASGNTTQKDITLQGGAFANTGAMTSTGTFTNHAAVSGNNGTLNVTNGSSDNTITQGIIAVAGNFDNDAVTAKTILDVKSGATFDNDAVVDAAKLTNDGTITQTAGTGELKIAGAGSYNNGAITQDIIEVTGGDFTNNATKTIMATTKLTVDPSAAMVNKGVVGSSGSPVPTVQNDGTFTNDTTGTVYATNLDNNSTMDNKNAIVATTVDNDGTYTNTGATSSLIATTINNNTGSFTNDGSVGASGTPVTTINNAAAFTNNATGTVLATTIDNKAGGTYTNSGKTGTATDPVTTILNNGTSFTNNGTGSIVANTITNNTAMENKLGGTIDSVDFTNNNAFTNNGTTTSTGTFTNAAAGTVDNGGTEGEGTLNVADGSNAGTITQGDMTIAAGNTSFANNKTITTEKTLTNNGTFDNNDTVNAQNSTNDSLFANNGTYNGVNSKLNADNVTNAGTANLTKSDMIVSYQTGDIAGTINVKGTSPADTSKISVEGTNPNIVGNVNVGSATDQATLDFVAGNLKDTATVGIASGSVLNIDDAGANKANVTINDNDTYSGDVKLADGALELRNIEVHAGPTSTTAGGSQPYYEQTGGTSTLNNATLIMADSQKISGGNMIVDPASVYSSQANGFIVDTLQNSGLVYGINNAYENYRINDNLVVGSAGDTQGDFTVDLYARSNSYKQFDSYGGPTTAITAGDPSLSGTVNISDYTLHGDLMGADAPIDRAIVFENLFGGVVQPGHNINFTATEKRVNTPIGAYRLSPAGGGSFKLELVDFNPLVFRGQMTKLAQYQNQLAIDDMLFTHSMVLPSFKDEDGGMSKAMMSNRYAGGGDLYAPYQYSRKDGGVWFKAYGNFEHLNMSHGLHAGNNGYGSLIGADFGLKELKNGWKFMPTAYVAYNGAHQHFKGAGAYQNGGQAGFLGTWYKDNFLLGALAYGGVYNNHMTVHGYSSEDSFGYFAGASVKGAYNWRLGDNFVIQPNLLAAYNYFGKENWHTDFGQMGMMSGMLHGVNIAPGVNFIYERDSWSAYLTVQYMYNVNQSIGGRAGNISLPRVAMDRGYIQYGVGATKKLTDRVSGYAQAVFRNAGRTGVGFQAGLEISLGKGSKKK